jgi:hypothetical protein
VYRTELDGGPALGVGGPARSKKGREAVYRTELDGGPALGVGGPARSKKGREAVYRTELDGGPDANMKWYLDSSYLLDPRSMTQIQTEITEFVPGSDD